MTGRRGGKDTGRLTARPHAAHAAPAPPPGTGGARGLHTLGVDGQPIGLRYVPPDDGGSGSGGAPAPAALAVVLHGAGAGARQGIDLLRGRLDEAGTIAVAPDSAASTWDLLVGGFGPDVERIDLALADTFARYPVDPARVWVGGFSDGASYALSLGLTNGDLFRRIVAFSPGFAAPSTRRGSPRVFVSHGVGDRVLPVEACGRRVARTLGAAGYDVHYTEFPGGHTVPLHVVDEALTWLDRTPDGPDGPLGARGPVA